MCAKFKEYKGLNLSQVNKDILKLWDERKTFEKSIETREGHPSFVFYEGPPSANGMPGIHHVMARTIKDIFCRYKTQQGFKVERKAGWDTHGLPVELSVEKKLGITKEDIGKTISIEEYNNQCKTEVMKYTSQWEELTSKMGYWVDMNDPYITYDSRYMETLWWLIKQLFEKGLLYKGYTIQPYSPAAGTGLSSHELNQPGCYRDVKDTTATAQFKVVKNTFSDFLFELTDAPLYFMAWTTTPWTLPSNTALAVGPQISYVLVRTFNPYTFLPVSLILAKDLLNAYFNPKNSDLALEDYTEGDKKIPFKVIKEVKGSELLNIEYEQLLPWIKPEGNAFRVIAGDYVTTEDGTGIVHIAPTFGADDDRVAKVAGISPLILRDKEGNARPMVDLRGKFYLMEELDENFVEKYVDQSLYKEFEGKYVKNAYDENLSDEDLSLDVEISILLKKENKAFKVEKHEHNYPHCWRTDKPVLYYPLDSWFIKSTAVKERMIELNNSINWKPQSTGTGRFGKWLENLNDWNLSRSRYWGTPLPIWVSEDKKEIRCIGSAEELIREIESAVQQGAMESNPFAEFIPGINTSENYSKIDLHKHIVDQVVLVKNGKKLYRENDLIDVWFDSGAMPFAQMHYPFENKELVDTGKVFPADFIAEGVDQTRGWFFTLHAIATMVKDSVAFKNIISNGLVLDKNGNKMSKRLNNAVDPFKVIEEQGSDPLRWYMTTNAQPWDNLKFDLEGVEEVKRKFFGTLYNTYSFFALYANIDGFKFTKEIPVMERPEIDRWIISLLNSLVKEVSENYENYEPTKAGRAIQNFVIENLSNWYVRLNRKRFWGGEFDAGKTAAYQTLYTCLETVALLAAPIAPFYMEQLYRDLLKGAEKPTGESVHLASFPTFNEKHIDKGLEERMEIAQQVTSMILSLRRKVNIKVRQPLQKIMIPVLNSSFKTQFEAVEKLILNEVNVKEVEYLDDTAGILVKKIKPNFKTLGPKYGKLMKQVSAAITELSQAEIAKFEQTELAELNINGEVIKIGLEDVEILSEDIPGWLVLNEGRLTVALDITITNELKNEGIAREFVNRIQNIRKDSGFEVTDKVKIRIQRHDEINEAIAEHAEFIGSQTLASEVMLVDTIDESLSKEIEINEYIKTRIDVNKL